MTDLGPIDEDVSFNHEAANHLIRVCNSAAGIIEEQVGSRAGWVSTAKTDFEGYFAELFARNQENAKLDADEVATRLRDVARQTGILSEEATSEQDRRDKAREWQRERDERNLLKKGTDAVGEFFGGEEKPPVGPMPEPSNLSATAIPPKPRETPQPGSSGGSSGSGTTSARPSDLRSFATGSQGANASLSGKPTTCQTAYDSFVADYHWGTLSADSVFSGFTKYLEANEEDVTWANTVAAAFEEAGGSGNLSTLPNSAITATLRANNVDLSRQDLTIDPPVAHGMPPTSGYADDPVNTATGNFIEPETDLGFHGGCASLALTRMYNSFDTGTGAFGPGWSSWTEASLELTDESARLRLPDGRVIVFPRMGEAWDRATGENMWLAPQDAADGTQVLVATTNDGEAWTYASDGRLLSHSHGAGTTVSLVHDDQQRVVRMEHERGRHVELTWDDEADRVVAASGSTGDEVSYSYDQAGQLVGVIGPRGGRTYHWNDAGLIERVVDPDGVVELENTYDDQRRVTAQRSPHGRTSRFVYLPGNVTVVSDPDGTRSNTWISDQRGRVIGIVDSDEQRQSTAYDAHGNAVVVTERDGAVTVHEYDHRGRRTRTVTPLGADLTFAYDEHDRVTTVVTESGAAIEHAYDGDSRDPSAVVDPEGGRTELTWEDGLLTRAVDPVGVSIAYSYNDQGDLVATTDALGNTARLERDTHGRVTAAVTPSGNRTTYSYATSGLLASRRDPDGAVWHYEHTAAGRVSAVVDPTGARTEIEHSDAGDRARTIDPIGRSVTRRFDDLGNVISMELPDGSAWEFVHDAMSRLTSATTPDGATWSREYDVTGGLAATIDPTGVRQDIALDRALNSVTVGEQGGARTTRFDDLGRPTSLETADGSTVMATYDRCGRRVELLDADGGLTRIERDAAGRATRVTTPGGIVTSYEYDECGRLSAAIAADGGRATRSYDADGRVIAVTMPTGEVSRYQYDECGRVIAAVQPGRGVSRYRYDAAGRIVESSDTWNGRRKFRYDAAGQLVEVVNGNGGATRYEYDTNGRAVAITDPLGNTTRREFDGLNRCTAETDPLGRTTRAGYDAAGRISWQEDADGHTTTWTYDALGQVAGMAVDGRVVSTMERDVRGRRATVADHTRDGAACTIELEWNRRGQIVRRARDGKAVTWTYDADGRRTSLTTPDGSTTSYAYDAVGRLASVEHPLLGRAAFVRDAAGRLVEATAGGAVQTWEHREGHVSAHTVTTSGGATRTEVGRDEDGRITGLTSGTEHTAFGYDEACQLIEARTTDSVDHWRYDAAGRLVAETVDGLTVEHTYDAAGQLVSSTDSERTTRYDYDRAGRRTREESSDGHVRTLEWTATGWLSSVTDQLPGGGTRRTDTHVDATGLLAEVDGTAITWDTASFAPVPVQAGDTAILATGPVTGIGDQWTTPGWRTQRSTGADPWSATGGSGALAGPTSAAGVSVGADGGISVAGMEWLGARVYDPASRGFLSVDPLDPVTGAGWAGNPYSYAGNDPLHALDPQGLKPLTDAELDTYISQHQGAWNGVTEWWGKYGDWVVGGLAVAAGVVCIATGFGGPLGAMLIAGGTDVLIQKATTGSVDYRQSLLSFGLGAYGGVGAARTILSTSTATRVLGTAARTRLTHTVVGSTVSGVVTSPVSTAYQFSQTPEQESVGDFVNSVTMGTAQNVVLGTAGHGIDASAMRLLPRTQAVPDVTPNHVGAPGDELVLGNNPDVDVARAWDGHTAPGTDLDDAAVQQAIDYQRPVYLASEPGSATSAPMQALQDAGYVREGDYMVPGGGS